MLSITGFIDSLLASLPIYILMLIYILLIALVALFALKKHLLTRGGAAASAVLGLSILYLGGLSAFFMLLFFFLTASLLSKAIGGHNELEEKGSERDALQVLANGLPAFVALLLSFATPYKMMFLISFACAIAEAEADTFAGDIGYMSHKDPVSILTFTKVPKGLSGGVTLLGIMGSLLGSALIALLFIGTYYLSFSAFALIAASGVLGALFDSLLGASLQVHYRDRNGRLTEHRFDKDGNENERARGIPLINNDMVNMLSGFFAAAIGTVFAYLIS